MVDRRVLWKSHHGVRRPRHHGHLVVHCTQHEDAFVLRAAGGAIRHLIDGLAHGAMYWDPADLPPLVEAASIWPQSYLAAELSGRRARCLPDDRHGRPLHHLWSG